MKCDESFEVFDFILFKGFFKDSRLNFMLKELFIKNVNILESFKFEGFFFLFFNMFVLFSFVEVDNVLSYVISEIFW